MAPKLFFLSTHPSRRVGLLVPRWRPQGLGQEERRRTRCGGSESGCGVLESKKRKTEPGLNTATQAPDLASLWRAVSPDEEQLRFVRCRNVRGSERGQLPGIEPGEGKERRWSGQDRAKRAQCLLRVRWRGWCRSECAHLSQDRRQQVIALHRGGLVPPVHKLEQSLRDPMLLLSGLVLGGKAQDRHETFPVAQRAPVRARQTNRLTDQLEATNRMTPV